MNLQKRFETDPTLPTRTIAGIELGGTKCVCTLGGGPGAIIDQQIVATTDPMRTLGAIRAILAGWQAGPGFDAIGIASFGPVALDRTASDYGHILATAKPGWSGADIVGRLGGGRDVPVAFDTDVNAAAIAEMRWGSGRALHDFAYVTVGTGIGVGLIVNGAPTRGIGHSELGHIRVPRLAGDTVPSVCPFHDDCVEGLASGTALKARLGARPIADVGADDPVWVPIVAALAALSHALVCGTGPRRIAIGGGMVMPQPHLLGRIETALIDSLNGYLRLPADGPLIVAPTLRDQAGPLGSIALGLAVDQISADHRRSPIVGGALGHAAG
ncbi:ROK family protein [Sphingomonas koreensis]|nr:ROK family protein [Sphingomonas koreensis]